MGKMSEPRDQQDLLIRYLLGAASAEERSEVEEQLFADESGVGVLVRAEDELIDDYVRGVLRDSHRQLFENHFLCTENRRLRLQAVQSLVRVLGQMESAAKPVLPEQSRGSFVHADRPARDRIALAQEQLAPAGFAELLTWLDSDYERAAEKFLRIQRRLIQLFTARGFVDAEALADKTIDRVASKFAQTAAMYAGDPARYFYGVAKAMMLETTKRSAHDAIPLRAAVRERDMESKQKDACLEKCLEQLPEKDRELVLQFYTIDKKEKLASRTALARSLGLTPNALRTRVHRIRHSLEKCVKSCLEREHDSG